MKVFGKAGKVVQATRRARQSRNIRRLGDAGEEAVRQARNIGEKQKIRVPGADRSRIPDGVTDDAISEVKNVSSQSFTAQLRDMKAIADATGRDFVLYVRSNTKLSGPLKKAIDAGEIILEVIPGS